MKTAVKDVCAFMEAWAPPELAYDWDKVGLHTGRPDSEVNAILVCLTVTPEAVRAARKAGANMIIAHHPLIWSPLKQLRTDDPQVALCIDLAKRDMACFIAHTNLDLAAGGVNDALTRQLQLKECRPLFPADHLKAFKLVTFIPPDHVDRLRDALAATGAGVIGTYTQCSFHTPGTGTFQPDTSAMPFSGTKSVLNKEAELRFEILVNSGGLNQAVAALHAVHPYEAPAYDLIPLAQGKSALGLGRRGSLATPMRLHEFAAYTREKLHLQYVISYGKSTTSVRTVAVLGGSGGASAPDLPEDIDVFVTGDIKYHDAQSALLKGAACIDASHAGTELPVLETIRYRLKQHFTSIAVTLFRERPLSTVHCASS